MKGRAKRPRPNKQLLGNALVAECWNKTKGRPEHNRKAITLRIIRSLYGVTMSRQALTEHLKKIVQAETQRFSVKSAT